MRLFFAAWPPAGTAETLARWARAAQLECGGRAGRAETIHLTLSFLGDADPAVAAAIAKAVRASALDLTLEQVRYWTHNRIIWAGPAETPPALAQLARALGEKREYAAHVTLVRHARHGRRMPEFAPLAWPVREFALVDSVLGPQGPKYRVLERYPLV